MESASRPSDTNEDEGLIVPDHHEEEGVGSEYSGDESHGDLSYSDDGGGLHGPDDNDESSSSENDDNDQNVQ